MDMQDYRLWNALHTSWKCSEWSLKKMGTRYNDLSWRNICKVDSSLNSRIWRWVYIRQKNVYLLHILCIPFIKHLNKLMCLYLLILCWLVLFMFACQVWSCNFKPGTSRKLWRIAAKFWITWFKQTARGLLFSQFGLRLWGVSDQGGGQKEGSYF